MGQKDDLRAAIAAALNLNGSLCSAEGILTGERIIQDDGLLGAGWVLLKLCKEKGQCERAAVARTERVLEARLR